MPIKTVAFDTETEMTKVKVVINDIATDLTKVHVVTGGVSTTVFDSTPIIKTATPTVFVTNVGETTATLWVTNNDASAVDMHIFITPGVIPEPDDRFSLGPGATKGTAVSGLTDNTLYTFSAECTALGKLESDIASVPFTTDPTPIPDTATPSILNVSHPSATGLLFTVRNNEQSTPLFTTMTTWIKRDSDNFEEFRDVLGMGPDGTKGYNLIGFTPGQDYTIRCTAQYPGLGVSSQATFSFTQP
jgi:hypothetical protein